MLRRLNQLDVPNWFENCHWLREIACFGDPYSEGDLTLYGSGDCKIGTRTFGAGVPIDDWVFAGGYIAKRRLDRPEWLVIRTPGGIHHYYRYRNILGFWERYTPLNDLSLDRKVQRLGPRFGSLVRTFERSAIDLCQEIARVFYVFLSMGVGVLKFWILMGTVFGTLWLIRTLLGGVLP
jgi:hypothetical protein